MALMRGFVRPGGDSVVLPPEKEAVAPHSHSPQIHFPAKHYWIQLKRCDLCHHFLLIFNILITRLFLSHQRKGSFDLEKSNGNRIRAEIPSSLLSTSNKFGFDFPLLKIIHMTESVLELILLEQGSKSTFRMRKLEFIDFSFSTVWSSHGEREWWWEGWRDKGVQRPTRSEEVFHLHLLTLESFRPAHMQIKLPESQPTRTTWWIPGFESTDFPFQHDTSYSSLLSSCPVCYPLPSSFHQFIPQPCNYKR